MIIRTAQIRVLEQASVDNFVLEICEHCKEFAPGLVEPMSDEELVEAVRHGMERAETYGFDKRGPVRFFIDMMISFGTGFDTDPQYPWAAEILSRHGEMEQMALSDELHAKSMDAFNIVFGPDNETSKRSIRQMMDRIEGGIQFKRDNFRQEMLILLKDIHPLKFDLVGEDALSTLIDQAIARGRDRYGFKAPRSMALMVMLMFALGHKFDQDRFHPWVSHTLQGEPPENPDDLAVMLERRALTWFKVAADGKKEG